MLALIRTYRPYWRTVLVVAVVSILHGLIMAFG